MFFVAVFVNKHVSLGIQLLLHKLRRSNNMFSHCLSVCTSVRSSSMIPVSEVQIPSDMSVALNLFCLCNLGSPCQGSFVRREPCHAPNKATLQHESSIRTNRDTICSICRLPPNRANGVVVIGGSSV